MVLKKLLAEFPGRNWSLASVKRLLHQIDTTGSSDRKTRSGRRRTVRTDRNASVVEELALSQEEAPGMHRTVHQIARESGITKSSVHRIIHRDLKFKCFKKRRAQDPTEANKNKRLACSRKLLRRYAEHSVPFIWFTDEKLFHVAPPVSLQNDRLYAKAGTRKKQLSADRLCVNVRHFPSRRWCHLACHYLDIPILFSLIQALKSMARITATRC